MSTSLLQNSDLSGRLIPMGPHDSLAFDLSNSEENNVPIWSAPQAFRDNVKPDPDGFRHDTTSSIFTNFGEVQGNLASQFVEKAEFPLTSNNDLFGDVKLAAGPFALAGECTRFNEYPSRRRLQRIRFCYSLRR